MKNWMRPLVAATLLTFPVCAIGWHGFGFFSQTCCDSKCKVCRPVCEVEKVTKKEFDVKCVDVCIPRPLPCKDCTPATARARTIHKLVIKKRVDEKPVMKWVKE